MVAQKKVVLGVNPPALAADQIWGEPQSHNAILRVVYVMI